MQGRQFFFGANGMKKLAVILALFLFVAAVLFFGSLGGRRAAPDDAGGFRLYFVNAEETKVLSVPYSPAAGTPEELIPELIRALELPSSGEEYLPLLGGEVQVNSWRMEDEQLLLDMAPSYQELSPVREVLTRAALVRSFIQVPGTQFITFTMAGEPLLDALGEPVGAMSGESFIENAGNEINAYERTTLRLYFTDKKGEKLYSANRSIVYNSNISLERLAAEQLIQGPTLAGYRPVVSSTTKVLSVTVKDNICYLNLDDGFLQQLGNVRPEVKLYAFVNTLTELNVVNRVQILVNGETAPLPGEGLSLDKVYERDLDIVDESGI